MILSKDTLARIKYLEYKARYLVTDAIAGEYLSAFKGRGVEFDEVRPYTPGDDTRLIDWNVTARMQEPFIKIHREEREFSVMLIVDTSTSLNFGTTKRVKKDLAAEVAAIFAFMASKNNDRIGLIGFSQGVSTFVPPDKGPSHIWNIIRVLLGQDLSAPGTDLKPPTDRLLNIAKRRTLCIVISDFRNMRNRDYLRRIRAKHDLLCVELYDQRELNPVAAGLTSFVDAETGEIIDLDLSDRRMVDAWKKAEDERRLELHSAFRKLDAGHFSIATSDDPIVPIERFMRQRHARRSRYG